MHSKYLVFSTEVCNLERTASPCPENNFTSAVKHEVIDVVIDLVWFNTVLLLFFQGWGLRTPGVPEECVTAIVVGQAKFYLM